VAILDLSKQHMYQFYYDVLKKQYGDKVRLLYTDTDSFILHIHTDDVDEDFRGMKEHFDFSGYDPEHPNYDKTNAKVLGKFKDEVDGKIIETFCGLKPKMYALQIQGSAAKKVAKGCPKHCIKREVNFESYMKTLFEGERTYVDFSCPGRGRRSPSQSGPRA
jgi:hypothetical protein